MMLFLVSRYSSTCSKFETLTENCCVTRLPFELGIQWRLLLEPSIRRPLQLLDPFRDRQRSAKSGELVNVIFDSAGNQRRTFQPLGNPADLRKERFAKCGLLEMDAAV